MKEHTGLLLVKSGVRVRLAGEGLFVFVGGGGGAGGEGGRVGHFDLLYSIV